MTSAGQLLQLLGDVASLFQSGAKAAADGSNRGSERWIFYTELKTEISILCSRISPLMDRFVERQWTASEDDCKHVSKQLLQFFENSLSNETQQSGHQTHQLTPAAYPNLDKLRKNRSVCIIPYIPTRDGQKHLLQQFTEWNKSLSHLSPKISEDIKQSKRSRPVWSIRDQARKLHKVLGDHWRCSCRMPHEGMMFLATHRKHRENDSYIDFDLLIGQPHASPPSWRQSKVSVVGSGICVTASRVRFAQDDPRPPPKARSKIDGVCVTISTAKPTAPFNMLVQDSTVWRTRPSPNKPGMANLEPTATLLNVLTGTTILSKESKIVLAVIISYSILYLYGSPWLPSWWDKRIFHFLRSDDDFHFSELLRPLIPAGYGFAPKPDAVRPGLTHGDPARLALGVILLEIFLQQPIEQLRQKEDLDFDEDGEITAGTNLYTAYRVHDLEDWDVHEGYEKAILACLDDANVDGLPWGDIKHRSFIYDNVIQPLEKELEAQCNINVEELDQEIARSGFVFNRQVAPDHNGPAEECSNVASLVPPARGTDNPDNSQDLDKGRAKDTAMRPHSKAIGNEQRLASRPKSPPMSQTDQNVTYDSAASSPTSPPPPRTTSSSSSECSFERTIFASCENVASAAKHISPKLLLGISLFDNQNTSINVADRADAWFDHLENILYKVMPPIPKTKDARIKIAILDTGVDMTDSFIGLKSNRTRIQYKSFVPGDSSKNPEDLVGHGTHVTGLLLKVARNADIFVARITKNASFEDPDQIAEAIRYATTEWEVNIISMSFGFPPLSEDLDCIQNAILAAQAKRIVLFAAAHNSGGLKSIAYPANRPEVICINATDGEGNPSHFNPSAVKGKNFSTLGEDVLSSWPGSVQRRMSGTSFATPIAAGIAAIVMDYVVQKSQGWSKKDKYVANKIKTREGVVKVFERHLSRKRGEFHFLAPWEFFHEDSGGEVAEVLLHTLRTV